MINSKEKTTLIELFGNEEECFYQLGLKDRDTAKMSLHHMRSLISTRWDAVNTGIHKVAAELFDKINIQSNHYEQLINAYSEGLNTNTSEIKFALMIPEICSFIASSKPDLSRLGLGCSSYFSFNSSGEPIHQRILDFPLSGTYDKYERVLLNSYQGKKKTINFSSSGLPFSGLTSMNEDGLTLSIHQKFTNTFNQHGESIFYLAHKLIHQCRDITDVKDFLMHHQSITNWNFNCLDQYGNVLSADLSGNKVTFLEHDLEEGPIYFCNELLDEDLIQADFLPSGITDYNKYRIETAYSKLKKLSLYDLDDKGILKYLTTPSSKNKFHIDTITLSTVNASLFNTQNKEALQIIGEAPKIFTGKIEKYTDVFDDVKTHELTMRYPLKNDHVKRALKHLALAQSSFDKNNVTELYHELQMAIETSTSLSYKNISTFYFIVVQYIFEDHLNVLSHLQSDLLSIQDELPQYFKELSMIIDQRISILCNGTTLIKPNFNSKTLKSRYKNESMKGVLAHKAYKKMTFIHIDIFDVIFL